MGNLTQTPLKSSPPPPGPIAPAPPPSPEPLTAAALLLWSDERGPVLLQPSPTPAPWLLAPEPGSLLGLQSCFVPVCGQDSAGPLSVFQNSIYYY